jgi:nitroreductase
MQAPLVIAVVSRVVPHVKIPDWEQVLSAGAACMNLLTGATTLGYGASWLTGWAAFDRRVLDALGLKPDERIAGFVHIGTAKEIPADRDRPHLADIVTRF